MADLLIRNVDEDTIRRIDANAARLGISRSEYLRREVQRAARVSSTRTTWADLERSAEACADLLDEEIMARAWS